LRLATLNWQLPAFADNRRSEAQHTLKTAYRGQCWQRDGQNLQTRTRNSKRKISTRNFEIADCTTEVCRLRGFGKIMEAQKEVVKIARLLIPDGLIL